MSVQKSGELHTVCLYAWRIASLAVLAAPSVFARPCESIHLEMREALAAPSREHFASSATLESEPLRPVPLAASPHPWMILVGFTGGMEKSTSQASGTVKINAGVDRHVADQHEVQTLTYNNFRWKRTASEVIEIIRNA